MELAPPQNHFIFVHGACHGAWSWYKLKPLLEAAGHRVMALDLSASGVDTKKMEELHSIYDYTLPLLNLLASIPPNQRVILVGHSLGGMSISLAMDKYPEKISVAVFLAAFMPNTDRPASYVLDQYWERTPAEAWVDTQFIPHSTPGKDPETLTIMFFGPKFLESKLYQLSPAEDLGLAKMLIRPSSLFIEDLSKANNFSKAGFGSIRRVYIVCKKDIAVPEAFQRWQIEISGDTEVMEINDADHMAMLSKPKEVCQCLLEIANKYA